MFQAIYQVLICDFLLNTDNSPEREVVSTPLHKWEKEDFWMLSNLLNVDVEVARDRADRWMEVYSKVHSVFIARWKQHTSLLVEWLVILLNRGYLCFGLRDKETGFSQIYSAYL